MTKEIPLTRGLVALVDDEDFDRLSERRWYVNHGESGHRKPYAVTTIGGKTVFMHRLILGVLPGAFGDHINRDPLDNRRANLRVCSRSENMWNRGPRPGAVSPYKGVSFRNRGRPWGAAIKVHARLIYLGRFSTEEEAARAYDAAAIKLHGEFAYLNFPQDNSVHKAA